LPHLLKKPEDGVGTVSTKESLDAEQTRRLGDLDELFLNSPMTLTELDAAKAEIIAEIEDRKSKSGATTNVGTSGDVIMQELSIGDANTTSNDVPNTTSDADGIVGTVGTQETTATKSSKVREENGTKEGKMSKKESMATMRAVGKPIRVGGIPDARGPCDMCKKAGAECEFERDSLNCTRCDRKKQACRWNGLNRKGELPKSRAKKGDSTKKVPDVVGTKRKRSEAVIEDSDAATESNASDSGDELPKSKSFFLYTSYTNCSFLSRTSMDRKDSTWSAKRGWFQSEREG